LDPTTPCPSANPSATAARRTEAPTSAVTFRILQFKRSNLLAHTIIYMHTIVSFKNLGTSVFNHIIKHSFVSKHYIVT
jgi:hypothetical protein